ncbi:hypothetical protein FHX42_003177 [Saccharopolyspora lacisalsi]|uniref:Uncharacterized protein n=1 Tax=Halosaccharopolyspora lacisalsi TaxID=1000566 RepID=A0A839E336_9PSEU|nr:hypothetical protein [Halosaccharopolyspora lacisalsi]MBA8825811.1 hypothetical protein [Halosaccharopolyspora lacisalsi]
MSARRYGLMRPGGATRVIALVLCLGMVVGFSSTYLVAAGLPVWLVLLLAILVVATPTVAATRSGRNRR